MKIILSSIILSMFLGCSFSFFGFGSDNGFDSLFDGDDWQAVNGVNNE